MTKNRGAITGSILRQVRLGRGMPAKDLAARLDISASYLSEIELGRRSMTPRIAQAVSDILQIQPDDIPPPECQDDPIPYQSAKSAAHQSPASPPSHPHTTDAEALAIHLLEKIPRPEIFAMIREFTTAAEAGDPAAIQLARATFSLLPSIAPGDP